VKILFLYSEYVGYLDGLITHLVSDHNADVRVVSWDDKLLKPFYVPSILGASFEKRSDFSVQKLVHLIEGFSPDLLYISGWMDSGYLSAVHRARNRQYFVTVCGFDDNWRGSLRQQIGAIYFRFFLRKYFDKAWVAGARQYHYARHFGYTDADISFNMLTCNDLEFSCKLNRSLERSGHQLVFFYVGNFRDVKGTDLLISAFQIYRGNLHGSCDLVCIGQGPMQTMLERQDGIRVFPYMSSSELISAARSFDVFVFPSRKDQWGVALHEFALLGFPILSSIGAGATERFLIDGYNGLQFQSGNAHSLAEKFKQFEDMPIGKLKMFGNRSHELGSTISSELAAASLASFAQRANYKQ
jgi:glycosyltransferase involved in cell wall biosynthesis